MLKVMIVDDEMLVRVGVKSTIQWETLGFTVVAEAGNGEEALQKIEQFHPDILLTDIRMPRMDGLELLRTLDNRGIQIETVIMSCYNEFELVREAMKLGASDYLLKLSLTEKELTEVLERIKKKIEKQKEPDSSGFFSQSDLREKLFQKIKDPDVSSEQKRRLSENLKLCVEFDGAALMLVMIDHIYSHERMGYEYQDEQSRNMTVNLLDDYLRGKQYGEIFWTDTHKKGLAIFLNQGLNLQMIAKNIQKKIEDYLKITVSVYVFADGMYEQCEEYIEYGLYRLQNARYLDGRGNIYCHKAEDIRIISRQTELYGLHQIKGGKTLLEKVDILLDQLRERRFPMEECRHVFTESVYEEASAFHRVGGSLKNLEERTGIELVQNLRNLETLDDVRLWFADFDVYAHDYMNECRSGQKRSEIEEAMRYIHENYKRQIGLKDVAQKAGLSTAYFSTVFKKENGRSFVEYLTNLRIEMAKELLTHHEICIYEVGEMVGYPEPNYFSKIFRKITGTSPEKYRKQMTEEN